MTYDASDGTTLTELIRLVRVELDDFPQHIHDTDQTGDGVKTDFRLYNHPYETDGVTVTSAGTALTEDTDYTVDYDSGWLTFTTAPADGAALVFDYTAALHSDEQIQVAINSAIDACYGPLFVQGQNDALVADGTPELLCETAAGYDLFPDDIVERVEYWSDPYWVMLHDWRINNHSGSKYLHFRRCPAAGTKIRISYTVRPAPLDHASDTVEGTAGLLRSAVRPLVLYACSDLVSQQLTARSHSNQFYNAEGQSATRAYDLRMRIQDLRAEAELALRRARQRRVVGSQ